MFNKLTEELKEDIQKQLNESQEDTETTKWPQKRFQQSPKWNQGNYKERERERLIK
jgi:hypothetical protein